jgi:protein TonB
MSYLNHAQDPRRRATALGITAVIHAAIAAGLVLGLTITGVAPDVEVYNPFRLRPDDPVPPPPPEPQPQHKPQDSYIGVPTPPLGPLVVNPIDIVDPDPFPPQDFVVDPRPRVEPVADPSPTLFTPRVARPANSQARWITNDDYPARALLDEAEGVAGYRLIVGTNGRVAACEVTRSTGNGRLDDATCDFIQRRARFEPATDETGAKVVGSFAGTVKWEIPD